MRTVPRPTRMLAATALPAALLCGLLAAPTPARQDAVQAPAPRPAGAAQSDPLPVAPAPRLSQSPLKKLLATEGYITPPKEIADAVIAAGTPYRTLTDLSPDGRKFVISKGDGMPAVARMGCPCVHLAEMAFDPVAGRSRDLWVRSDEGFDLFYHAENRTIPVQVPRGARVSNPVWSPDGSQLAFFAHFLQATHVCVADAESGACRQITRTPVLATLVTTFQWSRDGTRILTVLQPADGERPAIKLDGNEPKVRVARDGKNPSRTYRYLLETPQDMEQLEHLTTGQLALVSVADGQVTRVGGPGMIRSFSAAAGETQFRVSTVKKPFSFYVPFTAFGSREDLWDLEGKSLFTLNERGLRDNEPQATAPTTPATPTTPQPKGPGGFRKGGLPGAPQPPMPMQPQPKDPDAPPTPPQAPSDPDGKRDLGWRPDGAGMSFLQLEAAKKDDKEPRKDRVMLWVSPFGKDDTKVVYETPNRISSVQYSADCKWLFLTQTVDGQRQVSAVDVNDPKNVYVITRGGGFGGPGKGKGMGKGESEDDEELNDEQPPGFGAGAGALGGSGLMTRTGGVVRISSNGDVYLTGSDRGPGVPGGAGKPYIDSINIKTGKKTRVFTGSGEGLESITAVDGDDIRRVFTTRQKSDEPPNTFVTELATGKTTKLTDNVNRTPWFNKLKIERFQVTRVDGFKFWVKVTTAPNASGKLPALFWIYPREYTSQSAYDAGAGRGGTGGPGGAQAGRFTGPTPRTMAIVTLAGYALVEPDVPIVGQEGRMNDNYISDLRNSLWAAIDECDKRGIIDRDRLACGGHSYGAFSTANALAHTPFFKAGIAGDGCYNRTMTSMTFQSERRLLWDARETYLEMSPLLWANRVNGALLMYHGAEDANVGTNPVNAEHLFMALDGLGKDASLFMYPYEGHGQVGRETLLDMWGRWIAWLDLYVKNPKKG